MVNLLLFKNLLNRYCPTLIYLERKFLGGSGYLVICQDHSNFKEELKAETVNLMGRKWIKVCKDNHQMMLTQIS